MTLLAADIGGTKTIVALLTVEDGRLREVVAEEYASRSSPGFEPLLDRFLDRHAAARGAIGAGFGVAGPVIEGTSHVTNLEWVIDSARLEKRLGIPVMLLNDLEAMAYGIAGLGPGDLATLQAGRERSSGNAALIAAGTGLGEAVLFQVGDRFVPSPSEGGHADLAARNEEEIELLRFLLARDSRADYESVVSGPGLGNCYAFTHGGAVNSGAADGRVVDGGAVDGGGAAARPAAPHPDLLAAADPAAAIATAALAGSCPRCARSLDLFVRIYGAEAGNLALKVLAVRGVYVGGGIAPKILPALADGRFLAAFRDKGKRFVELMGSIPVQVILNPRAPLIGAALAAARSPAVAPGGGRG